ncbi:lutropin subunit beta-like [Cuculus canorus]|uniref:lutropin subunit beta-like n=1 Tax=Cuculus canorus TaxID=55661 RepID=UPI0023AA9A5D|nr:lutropin subunit beta-like [Cuculus canorus]
MGGAEVVLLMALLGTPPAVLGRPTAPGTPLALMGRPICRPINVTVALEKDECPQCVTVTVTACEGLCRSRAPVYRGALGTPPQSACVFAGTRYDRWVLPGCPSGIDPTVAVPVALGCRCGRCPMADADCIVQGLGPTFCGAPGGFGV